MSTLVAESLMKSANNSLVHSAMVNSDGKKKFIVYLLNFFKKQYFIIII